MVKKEKKELKKIDINNLDNELKNLLVTGEDWEKRQMIEGVNIVKLPENNRTPARLGIEIGLTIDKKFRPRIYIVTLNEFNTYVSIFSNNSLINSINRISEININQEKEFEKNASDNELQSKEESDE